MTVRNPSTGVEIGHVSATEPAEVARQVDRARMAHDRWSATPWRGRRDVLKRWWAVLSRDAEGWADAIRDEVGKPRSEAMVEVVATLDAVRWTIKNAGRALADEPIGRGWQRLLLFPRCRLRWVPMGVVGIVGTWNYPILLNAPAIAQAVAAGNGVVWKPSELAVGLGRRLQDSIDAAGFPEGLVSAVIGGPEVGRALVGSAIDKAIFTGGVENGREILSELGRRGIPALAELSGFDAAVVMPDAPLRSTVRALTWASFVGAGQTCVAVKRVYVIGDPAPWAEALANAAGALRVGDPASAEVDVGPMISTVARSRFHATIEAAIIAGARVMTGGSAVEGPGSFYRPTVLLADDLKPEQRLAGCFGPVVVVRGVADEAEAITAVNASEFGLAASVWGRDLRRAASVATCLEVGSVAVNEAVTTSGHAAAPFGGRKSSGFGRIRGVVGLRELAQSQVVHVRRSGGFRPHLFPYGTLMPKIFRAYRWIFHPR